MYLLRIIQHGYYMCVLTFMVHLYDAEEEPLGRQKDPDLSGSEQCSLLLV